MRPPAFHESGLDPARLDSALRAWGGFHVRLGEEKARAAAMLAAGRSFFGLPAAEKAAVAIERSGHFRGWSEMRNERDWREQLHLGRDRATTRDDSAFHRLEGPNLWPEDTAWRATTSRYIDLAMDLGQRILLALASLLRLDVAPFQQVGLDGYVIAKLIGYHPQASIDAHRSGVAPHVDFSWVTVNLQDSPGLDVRRPDGVWTPVGALPDAVWVHAGELLEHAAAGRYRATPHRVVNPSLTRTRLSIPVFVNPPLDSWVPVLAEPARPTEQSDSAAKVELEHVHRVLDPSASRRGFHFGQAEWKRKGLGRWCHVCCPDEDAGGVSH